MNRLLITFALLLAAGLPAAATEPAADRREEFAQKQARLFADKLGLDDVTADKFVKLFVKNQREKWTLQPEGRNPDRNRQYKTDAQIDSAINAQFVHSQKILDMRKKYYKEYRKLLTAKQVQMLYDQESKMAPRMRNANKDIRKRAEINRKKAEQTRKKVAERRKAKAAARNKAKKQ